ncbi:hypothetical protein QJU87_04280 [Pasteurella skyensis]|uniref:hypothetical protein n=1 Tax=Phocoenobacter skyensis TaxID=97481 RepID=UPI0027472273|nr:hypothetical protein [Pasteurella skyensis]MDP8189082.1 hypothetical protein [Pasteurella skyensis]
MVDLFNINDQLEKLPSDQKKAIIALINIKTEDDMEKVLNKLNVIETKFDAKFEALESKFDAKFDAIDSKFESVDKALSAQKWFIVTTISLVGILTTLATTYISSHPL